jgi:hypothetical protein
MFIGFEAFPTVEEVSTMNKDQVIKFLKANGMYPKTTHLKTRKTEKLQIYLSAVSRFIDDPVFKKIYDEIMDELNRRGGVSSATTPTTPSGGAVYTPQPTPSPTITPPPTPTHTVTPAMGIPSVTAGFSSNTLLILLGGTLLLFFILKRRKEEE